ncbi:DUF378 domain-containing protein [Candidatus Pacearchaeota archaeon]|nr:DUF378 domain-containing protein [Candidatus Pacearchaeota archaeon]|tara:strand:+ start:89 stop:268 length:180 start_codon:yes stop_codon:yes gene_type:complete
MNSIDWIAKILLIIGGLNWGLAIWNINLVTAVSDGIFATIIYALVGISALWAVYKLVKK